MRHFYSLLQAYSAALSAEWQGSVPACVDKLRGIVSSAGYTAPERLWMLADVAFLVAVREHEEHGATPVYRAALVLHWILSGATRRWWQ